MVSQFSTQTQKIETTKIDFGTRSQTKKFSTKEIITADNTLPKEDHDKAVDSFDKLDYVATGMLHAFKHVEDIPGAIDQIIDNKFWECFCVNLEQLPNKYYRRFNKGTDKENFVAYIVSRFPDGLDTKVEVLDKLLSIDLAVQNKFRAIVELPQQGKRTDLKDSTSAAQQPKSENLKPAQQKTVRSANRAAEAMPEIKMLMDTANVSPKIAAHLGKKIKNPDNPTDRDRKIIEERQKTGVALKKLINDEPIPEKRDRKYLAKANNIIKKELNLDKTFTVWKYDVQKTFFKLIENYSLEQLEELADLVAAHVAKNGVTKE